MAVDSEELEPVVKRARLDEANGQSFPGRSRQYGKVRWYSGRRQIGCIESDDGRELFVPVGGAANRNLVPATAGGLFHGTRVSFTPVDLADMGGSRDACVDVRPCEDQSLQGMSCGVETRIGGRATNEDRLAANDVYDLGFLAGVFDGHGGSLCVDFITQRFPANLHALWADRVKKLKGGLASTSNHDEIGLIRDILKESFTTTDHDFMHLARSSGLRDGSTGVVVLLAHGFEASSRQETVAGCPGGTAKLFVGWCGDSRAVLVKGKSGIALSKDHKPNRHDEEVRIKRAGGAVVLDQAGIHRVGPKPRADYQGSYLSTSRSFGDLELKEPDPLVIADPEVKVHTLTPDDWAVVLCSDGVFNVMSDQDVADTCWNSMVLEGQGPIEAANAVADRSQINGSTDNITVLVMRLGWSNPQSNL